MRDPSPADAALEGLLEELVDRMAHQVKNPLQAIVVSLEVIRLRGPRATGTAWEREVARFVERIESSVGEIDRRLKLLLAVARAGGERPGAVPLARRIRDLVGAVGLEPPPEIRLEGEVGEAVVTARPGHLVALLHLLLEGIRSRSSAGKPGELRLRGEEGHVVLDVRLPGAHAGSDGGAAPEPGSAAAASPPVPAAPDAPHPEDRERMERLVESAGGALEVLPGDDVWMRVRLPRS